MKTRLSILTLLAVCLFYQSQAKGGPSKENAKNQIGQTIYRELSEMFSLNKLVDDRAIPENVAALKKTGFIALSRPARTNSQKDDKHNFVIKVLKKGEPYFVKEENNYLYFKGDIMPIEISSISEPKSDGKGNQVCTVKYTQKIVYSDFLRAWKPHCYKEGTMTDIATFVKKADGWKCETPWQE